MAFYFNHFWIDGIAKRSPLDSLRRIMADEHIADAKAKRERKQALRRDNAARRLQGIAFAAELDEHRHCCAMSRSFYRRLAAQQARGYTKHGRRR